MIIHYSHNDVGEASQAIPLRKLMMGKRKSIAHPLRDKECKVSTSPAGKQTMAKAPMPSKARANKEKEPSNANCNEEST